MGVEIGRSFLSSALSRVTANEEGAKLIGANVSGATGQTVQAILVSLKGLIDGKVSSQDTRLSDSRTPTAHKASHSTGGTDALTAANIGAASTTHKATHATGGTDALAPADIGAAASTDSRFHDRAHSYESATDHTDIKGALANGQIYVKRTAGASGSGLYPENLPTGGSSAIDRVTTISLFDDFVSGSGVSGDIGELGWLFTTGGAVPQPAEADARGVVRRNMNATASQVISTQLSTADPLLAADAFDIQFRFRVAGGLIGLRFGLLDTTTTVPANGVFIDHVLSSGVLTGATRAAGVQSLTPSLHTLAADTWVKARVRRINPTTVGFSINGGAEATLTTNIPTAPMDLVFQATNGNANVRSYDLDYVGLLVTGLNR